MSSCKIPKKALKKRGGRGGAQPPPRGGLGAESPPMSSCKISKKLLKLPSRRFKRAERGLSAFWV